MLYRKGSTVFGEIIDQPKMWRTVLSTMESKRAEIFAWIKSQNFGQVIYMATSDLYNAAMSAAKITHLVSGLNSLAASPAEIMYGRRPPYDARIRTLVVVLSAPDVKQELVWGIEKLKQMDPKAQLLALEVEDASIAAEGLVNYSILFSDVKDASKTPIHRVSGLLLASFVLVSWLSGKQMLLDELNRLPDIGEAHIKDWQVKAQQLVLDKPAHMVFLGSGPFLGIAREAAAMVARTAAVHSGSDTFAEYRHGAYGCTTNQSLIVGLMSNTFKNIESRILADVGICRARRVAVAEESSPELITRCDDILELKSGVSEIARVLLMLPAVQFIVFYLAMSRGINPDNPKHLDHPVIALKERPGAK